MLKMIWYFELKRF